MVAEGLSGPVCWAVSLAKDHRPRIESAPAPTYVGDRGGGGAGGGGDGDGVGAASSCRVGAASSS